MNARVSFSSSMIQNWNKENSPFQKGDCLSRWQKYENSINNAKLPHVSACAAQRVRGSVEF